MKQVWFALMLVAFLVGCTGPPRRGTPSLPALYAVDAPAGMDVVLDPEFRTQVTLALSDQRTSMYDLTCRSLVTLQGGPEIVGNRVSWGLLTATDEAGRILASCPPQSNPDWNHPAWRAQLRQVFDDYRMGLPRNQSLFQFTMPPLERLPARLAQVRLAAEVFACDGLALHEHAVTFDNMPVVIDNQWQVKLRPVEGDAVGAAFDVHIEPAQTDERKAVKPPLVVMFELLNESGGTISEPSRLYEEMDGGVRVLSGRVRLHPRRQRTLPMRWRLGLAIEPRVERFEVVLTDVPLPTVSP